MYCSRKILLLIALALVIGCEAESIERYPYHTYYDDDDDYYDDDDFFDEDIDIDFELDIDKDIDINADADIDLGVDVDLGANIDAGLDIDAQIDSIFDRVEDLTNGTIVIGRDRDRDSDRDYDSSPAPYIPRTRPSPRPSPRRSYTPRPLPNDTTRPTSIPRTTDRPRYTPTPTRATRRPPRTTPTRKPSRRPSNRATNNTQSSLSKQVGELFALDIAAGNATVTLAVENDNGNKIDGALLRLGGGLMASTGGKKIKIRKLFLTRELADHLLAIRGETSNRHLALTARSSPVTWTLQHDEEQVTLKVEGGMLTTDDAVYVAVKLHLVTVSGAVLVNSKNNASILINDGRGEITFKLSDNDTKFSFSGGCYRWAVETLSPDRALFGNEFGGQCQ